MIKQKYLMSSTNIMFVENVIFGVPLYQFEIFMRTAIL